MGAAWPGVSQEHSRESAEVGGTIGPGGEGQGDTALRLPLSKEHWVLRSMYGDLKTGAWGRMPGRSVPGTGSSMLPGLAVVESAHRGKSAVAGVFSSGDMSSRVL